MRRLYYDRFKKVLVKSFVCIISVQSQQYLFSWEGFTLIGCLWQFLGKAVFHCRILQWGFSDCGRWRWCSFGSFWRYRSGNPCLSWCTFRVPCWRFINSTGNRTRPFASLTLCCRLNRSVWTHMLMQLWATIFFTSVGLFSLASRYFLSYLYFNYFKN